MTTDDFDYALPPPEQIAQYPLKTRSASKLLCYLREQKKTLHQQFNAITEHLHAGDLLVFNNTQVIPARLFARKATGGQVEILVERVLDNQRQFLAHVQSSKPIQSGAYLMLEKGYIIEMLGRQSDLFIMQLSDATTGTVYDCLNACGHMPLPPYIQRSDLLEDVTRYQTVYAEHPGAVAAPTAGLHFDEALLATLAEKGVQQAFLTLHVGAGTFQPVRVTSIADHVMHSEYLSVDQALCDRIMETKKNGGRIIAVGTTVVRALETAALSGTLQPYIGDTQIFITPGFPFRVVNGLITNFHWPRSTLLMLVSAFIPREKLLALYQEAIAAQYRFFSYGDAMLII